jgi:hypothetical protein
MLAPASCLAGIKPSTIGWLDTHDSGTSYLLTGMVVPRDQQAEMREKRNLATWCFASKDLSEVHLLTVPHLTIRERLFLERAIGIMAVPDLKEHRGGTRR